MCACVHSKLLILAVHDMGTYKLTNCSHKSPALVTRNLNTAYLVSVIAARPVLIVNLVMILIIAIHQFTHVIFIEIHTYNEIHTYI